MFDNKDKRATNLWRYFAFGYNARSEIVYKLFRCKRFVVRNEIQLKIEDQLKTVC